MLHLAQIVFYLAQIVVLHKRMPFQHRKTDYCMRMMLSITLLCANSTFPLKKFYSEI